MDWERLPADATSDASDDWAGDSDAELAFAPDVRFFPDSIDLRTGKLRGMLLIMPNVEHELVNFTSQANALLDQGVTLRFALDPDNQSPNPGDISRTTRRPLCDFNPDHVDAANSIWTSLLFKPTDPRMRPETIAIIRAVARAAGQPANALSPGDPHAAFYQGARQILDGMLDAADETAVVISRRPLHDPNANMRFGISTSGARNGDEPAFVGSQSLARLESALGTIGAIRFLHSASRPRVSVPGLSNGQQQAQNEVANAAPVSPESWIGAADLFRSTHEAASQPGAASRSVDETRFIDAGFDAAATNVVCRGLQQGLKVSAASNDRLKRRNFEAGGATIQASGPRPLHAFHRHQSDPGPETQISAALQKALSDVRDRQIRESDDHHQFRAPDRPNTPLHPIERITFEKLSSDGIRFGSALQAKINELSHHDELPSAREEMHRSLAEHLLALRPDGPVDAPHIAFDADDGPRRLAPAEVHAQLEDIKEIRRRRLFGLLAFPAFARVVKLVVDVEFNVADLPQFVRDRIGSSPPVPAQFFVAATLTNSAPLYWSACQIVGIEGGAERLFVTAGVDEMPAGAGPLPAPETQSFKLGTLNLSQIINRRARYSVSCMDVVSRAEQFINKLEAQSNEQRSGVPAEEGDGSGRTVGVAIRDFDRAMAVQHEIARGKRHQSRLAGQDSIKLHAEDLVSGYRLDVAVMPRAHRSSDDRGSGWAWRSLNKRNVTFRPLKTNDGVVVNVERLVTAALKASLGETASEDEIARLKSRLDEASARPASRVVTDQPHVAGADAQSAEIIALDTLAQWEGDPLGAPCFSVAGLPQEHSEINTNLDLELSHELNLPSGADDPRPPRLEIGRPYRFGMRCTYAGGGGLTVEQARALYDRPVNGSSIPPLPASAPPGPNAPTPDEFKFLRHERVAAPALAMIDPRPASRPGDALKTLIVRSNGTGGITTRSARRILYVPGLPMSLAAAHPHPDPPSDNPYERALDRIHTLQNRPVGGLPNVLIDPKTGGLPVKLDGRLGFAPNLAAKNPDILGDPNRSRAEGVFKVERMSAALLGGREAHYYPDPAVHQLVFQLWTRGDNPLPALIHTKAVPVYDPEFLQNVPWRGPTGTDAVQCTYPFAIPVIVEILAQDGPGVTLEREPERIKFDPRRDTGYLDSEGRFKSLRAGEIPPAGSLTVRRLRISLSCGDDFDLRCWCGIPEPRLRWFDLLDRSAKLLRQAHGDSDLCSIVADRLQDMPIPEQAETTDLRVVYAVQKPVPPSWPPEPEETRPLGPPPACAAPSTALLAPICPPQPAAPAGEGLQLLRRVMKQERWPEWLGESTDNSDWHTWREHHQIGAATTWLGGTLSVDRKATESIALEISYRNVRDPPGQPIPVEHGELSFGWLDPQIVSIKLYPLPVPPGGLTPIDIVREGLKTNGLFANLPDSRAYRLRVAPVATSRFSEAFEPPAEGQSGFSSKGQPTYVWALATRRPDPMSYVELVPAFVWTEDFSGPSVVHRRMVVRLMWRRPRGGGRIEGSKTEAVGSWFSSGEGERLCLLFRKSGEPFGSLGPLENFVTQWGADPIRESRHRPPWQIPLSAFHGNPHAQRACDIWVPVPGEGDEEHEANPQTRRRNALADNKFAYRMDLLTFEPLYDHSEDAWYVDIDVDPRTATCDELGAPILRFGIARYQQHAMSGNAEPRRDLRVSRPHKVEFALQPSRQVKVSVGRRGAHGGLWPIDIEVRGPLATIKGGASDVRDPLVRDRFAAISRPRFTAQLLRKPATLLDAFGEGGEEIVAEANSDAAPPPQGDLLWQSTIYVSRNPYRTPHFIFIREVDVMLSAHADAQDVLVESGPRFMAKIPIRRDSSDD